MGPANRTLGKYRLGRKLGRGGMADVYLASDGSTGRLVALKLIEYAADTDTRDAIAAERRGSLLQQRLAAVDPRVVRIYEYGDLDGFFVISMEYVEGRDLAEVIRPGPLPAEHAARVAAEICETLAAAHTLEVAIEGKDFHGIVHGDIKPRNIRIDRTERVRVLDFGIAKALSLSRRLTRNEFGSVPYASPERLDTGDVDASSDLWALGVVLYEMLAGRQPFQAESTEKLERSIRLRAPAPPLPESVPEPLRRIVGKALAADPGRRYTAAGALRADLEAFLTGGEVEAAAEPDSDATRRTASLATDGDATRRTAAPRPAPRPPGRHAPQAGRKIALALAAALLLWIGYGISTGYFLWNRGRGLAQQIDSERLTDPDDIWKRWQALAGDTPRSLLLRGARNAVRNSLVAAASRTIDSFRNDESRVVFENDWRRALAHLSQALDLDPGNNEIRGKMRLCEGHLARIARQFAQAGEKYHQAAELLPRSPDPYLGLARLYIYGLKDLERADAALREAAERGHPTGRREKLYLAEGYRDRGDQLWHDSQELIGLPQEKEQLRRSAADYKRSIELYQSIAPYGNASANLARAQSNLDGVEFRLKQLEGGWFRWP